MQPTLIAVGGSWGNSTGIKIGSKVFNIIVEALNSTNLYYVESFNGGSFQELEYVYRLMRGADVVLWMANVDNSIPKHLVQNIKQDYPKVILTSSKRNRGSKYSFQEIVAHGLKLKSNLVLEIDDMGTEFVGRLLDPLGNIWQNYTSDFRLLAIAIATRMMDLSKVTRQATVQSPEEAIPLEDIPYGTKLPTFFATVKRKAEIFQKLINPADGITRFLGNTSFRCERGFPSVKFPQGIYVSQRNVDKRYIGPEAMVLTGWNKEKDIIWYRGNNKPSVDTPIQVRLYELMPSWVNFMLHSHVYIKDAPFTEKMIPCGGLEEVDEIMKVVNNMEEPNMSCYTINLKGHGSLICAYTPSYFDQDFYARPIPELM